MSLNVLVIDRFPPWDRLQGNSLIGREVFSRLRHRHRMTLVAPVEEREISAAEDELRLWFEHVILVPRPNRMPALAGAVEARLAQWPGIRRASVRGLNVPSAFALRQRIDGVAASGAYDVVHVRQLPMAEYAGRIRAPKLLELIDSETLAAERAQPRTSRTRARAKAAALLERAAMSDVDVVTAVGTSDAERLRRLSPRTRVEVVPNGVDAERFRPDPTVAPVPGRMVFVGAMSFPPNVQAMQRFCDDVFPEIRRRHAGAHLVIVGRDPSAQVRALAARDGVTVTGQVPDVLPHLHQASVFVAPMVSGSGIKNKVLEALAAGRPVVATPLAVEGLGLTNGREVVVSRMDAMAQDAAQLLENPSRAEELGRRGREAIESSYTWDACASAYARLYRELAASRQPGGGERA